MSSKGSIIARISTADEILPIMGASVMVVKKQDGKDILLGFRLTDRDGKTKPIEVDTPDSSLSIEPGNENPFALVDIMIEKLGFYPVVVHNAQVFGGQVTEQNVSMIPLPQNETASKLNRENVDITPQNL